MNHLDELIRDTLDDRASQAPAAAPVIGRVLTDRSRRRRRGWLAMAATAAVTATVVAVGVGVTRGPDGSGSAPAATDATDAADERTAEIYSVALERFLIEGFRRQGGVPDEVYVAIRPDKHAGWDWDGSAAGDPIPSDIRDEISAQLADLTRLMWVHKLPAAEPVASPDPAKAAVTLGLLPDGDEVNVSVSAFYGFDNGWLHTYVVELRHGQWRITGTDAPSGVT